jgi:hypothetical protein
VRDARDDDAGAEPEHEDFPSGEWVGFYQAFGSRHRQRMHLLFRKGQIVGDGIDDVGEFTIRGRYDAVSRETWWTKSYPSHDVFYRGFGELEGIWGTWDIPPAHRGGFHIWPRYHGEGEGKHEHTAVEEPVTVTAGG